jgi:predicted ATPase
MADGAGRPRGGGGVRRQGVVPAESSPLVGRRGEVAEAKRLLEGARLVTLTGMAGVGKTRVAVRVMMSAQRAFPDGVWFVDLAAVSVGELVAQTVVTVLGLDRENGEPPLTILVDALR